MSGSLLRDISANTVAINSFGALFIGLIAASTWACPRNLVLNIVLSWPFRLYGSTLLLNDSRHYLWSSGISFTCSGGVLLRTSKRFLGPKISGTVHAHVSCRPLELGIIRLLQFWLSKRFIKFWYPMLVKISLSKLCDVLRSWWSPW